jgi:iron(III) transport system substrate-binding protein
MALIAATPAYAQTQSWDQVVAAAKKEGQVIFEVTHVTADYDKRMAEAFEKQTGIKVLFQSGRGTEIVARLKVEQSTGKFLGDVVQSGTLTLAALMPTLTPHGPLPDEDKVKPDFKADEMVVPHYLQAYGLLVNTDLVPAGKEPKSWADLGAPQWSGKILSDDPRVIGGGLLAFQVQKRQLGADAVAKIAANKPVITRDIGDAEQRVARGEYAIYTPMVLNDALNLKGLPVKTVIPSEGAVYVVESSGMLKNAPHPNAARLWLNFQLTETAQLILAAQGNIPVMSGIENKVSPEAKQWVAAKLMGQPVQAELNDTIASAKELYK